MLIDDYKYDYLIVGTGLFGAVFAHEVMKQGYKCLVIDKRNHVGGNCYTEDQHEINVHVYGPHIFHCADIETWRFINQFATFNHFRNSPRVNYKGRIFSFPINLMTLNQLYGVKTPEEAREKLDKVKIKNSNPRNLEEYALSQVGRDIYEIFFRGYTLKQWGKDPRQLPANIIKRLPIRFNYDDNYFNDRFQGIPIGGYTPIIHKLLEGAEILRGVDYFSRRSMFDSVARRILYTGMIDEFYDYRFGELEYRGLRFEHDVMGVKDYQGVAVVNYTDYEVPYTRTTEHNHFQMTFPGHTIVSTEYPTKYIRGDIPYYPVRDVQNTLIYEQYRQLANRESRIIFGGRLANYVYWDMHQTIPAARGLAAKELEQ